VGFSDVGNTLLGSMKGRELYKWLSDYLLCKDCFKYLK
jgi:hypothetical protein